MGKIKQKYYICVTNQMISLDLKSYQRTWSSGYWSNRPNYTFSLEYIKIIKDLHRDIVLMTSIFTFQICISSSLIIHHGVFVIPNKDWIFFYEWMRNFFTTLCIFLISTFFSFAFQYKYQNKSKTANIRIRSLIFLNWILLFSFKCSIM